MMFVPSQTDEHATAVRSEATWQPWIPRMQTVQMRTKLLLQLLVQCRCLDEFFINPRAIEWVLFLWPQQQIKFHKESLSLPPAKI